MLSLTYSLADQNFAKTKSVGIFNLSVDLLKALAGSSRPMELTVLLNSALGTQLSLPSKVRTCFHEQAVRGRMRRIWWDQWGVYRAAKRLGQDWLFLPKGFASFLAPCPVKLALYAHDTILESYYQDHPGVSRLECLYFSRSLGAGLRQARVIFTNSDFTSRELSRAAARRGIKPPPIIKAGIGFQLPEPTREPRVDEIVVLAGAFPHKRTDLALDYLARWQAETKYPGRIEWVGRLPPRLPFADFPNWRHSPRLSHAEYQARMQRCRVLIFFSDYEGFGMPPVEAVLNGMCPVYSEIEATREVMAGAGCSFQNKSYDSFARALQAALAAAPGQIEAWKQALTTRFDWALTRDRIIEALVSAQPPPS